MKQKKGKILIHVAILKVLAALLVVLGHSSHIYVDGWVYSSKIDSKFFWFLTHYIYSFHMPLFVFITGYVYYYTKVELHKYNKLEILTRNKFMRLLIPYYLVGIFYLIPIRTLLGHYKGYGFLTVIFKGIILAKFSGNLWFLWMIFNVFVLFYIMEKRIKSNNTIINFCFMFVMFIAGNFLLKRDRLSIFQIPNILIYFIYFYCGYIFRQHQKSIKSMFTKYKHLGLSVFILHLVLFFILNSVGHTIPQTTNNFKLELFMDCFGLITAVSSIIFYYYLSVVFERKYPAIMNNRLFNILQKYNFKIYLFHYPIIFIILYFIADSSLNPFILVNSCFILSIILSILLDNVLLYSENYGHIRIRKSKCAAKM